jgi:hypothetical protein
VQLTEQINEHYGLFLRALDEWEPNALRLVIEEARPMGDLHDTQVAGVTITDCRTVDSDESCRAYEVRFDLYVAYSVLNESFATADKSEKYEGRLFRLYTVSRFLDFVRSTTWGDDDYPGPIRHYEVVCLDHIIDVATAKEPVIRLIRDGQPSPSADDQRPC